MCPSLESRQACSVTFLGPAWLGWQQPGQSLGVFAMYLEQNLWPGSRTLPQPDISTRSISFRTSQRVEARGASGGNWWGPEERWEKCWRQNDLYYAVVKSIAQLSPVECRKQKMYLMSSWIWVRRFSDRLSKGSTLPFIYLWWNMKREKWVLKQIPLHFNLSVERLERSQDFLGSKINYFASPFSSRK